MPLFRGGARGNPVFGANSPHQLLHRHRLSRQLRLGGLFAFGRRRIQEHAKAGVHRNLRHLWHERVQHLPRLAPSQVAGRVDSTIQACAIVSAASPGPSVGIFSYLWDGTMIGVRSSGMLMVLKATPCSANPLQAQRAQASSAASLVAKAEKRVALVDTPIEPMLTT